MATGDTDEAEAGQDEKEIHGGGLTYASPTSAFAARSVQTAGLFQSSFCHKGFQRMLSVVELQLQNRVAATNVSGSLRSAQDSSDRVSVNSVTYDARGQG